MKHVLTADVPAVLEHDDTVASHFMIPFGQLRQQTEGSYLQFVNEFLVEPGKFIEPHYHDSHEFYYVLSGRGTMRVGDDVAQVSPGDLIHTPPNVPHSIYAHRSGVRCLAFAVAFTPEGAPTHTATTFDNWPPAI
ncbi:cupin domain-containing protein [Rhodococcus sp. NPDC057014]|uniref:cupin domain-containing protein n=1 Tax=Rhodococcus sp. NPDC057014 TaxID=3346000 RepID=UPI00363D67EB